MSNAWILVANRSNARLFTNNGSHKSLSLVDDFYHSTGRHREQDLNSDKPGRLTGSSGQSRHGVGEGHSATEHEAESFARELAQRLNQGRTANDYSRLVLVAEPGFLGLLKAALDDQTVKLLSDTIPKDLVHMQDADIPAVVLEHIRL